VSEAIIFTTLTNSSPTVAEDMLAQAKQSIFFWSILQKSTLPTCGRLNDIFFVLVFMKYIANKFWEISQARDFYNTFSIRGHSESY